MWNLMNETKPEHGYMQQTDRPQRGRDAGDCKKLVKQHVYIHA